MKTPYVVEEMDGCVLVEDLWHVVEDMSGHYRSISIAQPLAKGEKVVDGPFQYREACQKANLLNYLAEVQDE